MTVQSLTLVYRPPSSQKDPLDLLRLEQEKWSVYTGKISKGEMIRWLGAMVRNTPYQSRIDCGVKGDQLVCTLYAYPYTPELNYQLYTSWGTLSDRRAETIEIRELVQFRLTVEERTDYPVRRILGVDWADECYGSEGEIVSPPVLSVDRETLFCDSPVYGTAEVRYLCERHTYTLNATRRETAIDNQWSAVVVGVYDGGLSWTKIKMPHGVEQLQTDADCGRRWGFGVVITGDEPLNPQSDAARRITKIDYCTQRVISDRIE